MKFGAITLAAALLAVGAPLQAQQQDQARRGERMDPKQRIERRVERLDDRLDLTDAQVGRIRTILTQEAEQMKSHFAARGPRGEGQRMQRSAAERDSMRTQMKAARERTDAAILQVLNDSQRAEYQKFQQERPKHGERGKRGGEKRGERKGTRTS